MKIFISFIMNIILCIAYCLCIDMVNIYKPIAHMDISMGILFRILNRKMKIFISFIMNIILCIAYCLCIDMVNIYKPIAHMDISMGILFRIGAILMFLTLLMGMLAVRFTKRKYLIDMVNIYKPIAHMDISMGILFRIGAILMFLTLLMGMLAVRFTKRKYLIALPMIIPILLWSAYIGVFPYRSFAYMGISVLIYLTYMAILWYYNNKSPIRQKSKNMAIKLKRHKGLTITAVIMVLVLSGWLYRELHPTIIFHTPQENKYLGKVSGINGNITKLYTDNHIVKYRLPYIWEWEEDDEVAVFINKYGDVIHKEDLNFWKLNIYLDENNFYLNPMLS